MLIKDIIQLIEAFAPLAYQESYDNCGLIIGNAENAVTKALLTLDITESVLQEAIDKKCDIIISHHPLIFNPIKQIQGKTHTERTLIKAIRNNISVYAAHTNMDFAEGGLSHFFAEKIGLKDVKVLRPLTSYLRKLVTFCPIAHSGDVRTAIFEAGAGHIGDYDCCSYNIDGKGSFRASDKASPFVGQKHELHFEEEVRIETIYPRHLEKRILAAMLRAHPYEEVAYDIYPLENAYKSAGMGIIGALPEKMTEEAFLKSIKATFNAGLVKHSAFTGRLIAKVAFSSGAGSSLINDALNSGADIFVSAEFKHNHFIDVENKMLIADIGHYESESFVKELFYNLLKKNFPNFAVEISEKDENPIKYL